MKCLDVCEDCTLISTLIYWPHIPFTLMRTRHSKWDQNRQPHKLAPITDSDGFAVVGLVVLKALRFYIFEVRFCLKRNLFNIHLTDNEIIRRRSFRTPFPLHRRQHRLANKMTMHGVNERHSETRLYYLPNASESSAENWVTIASHSKYHH